LNYWRPIKIETSSPPPKRRRIIRTGRQHNDFHFQYDGDDSNTVFEELVTGRIATGMMPSGGLYNTRERSRPPASQPLVVAYSALPDVATARSS
jgi:hypothetical protein